MGCDCIAFLYILRLFNSVSAISGRWVGKSAGCVQSNPVYDLKDSRLRRGLNPGPLV